MQAFPSFYLFLNLIIYKLFRRLAERNPAAKILFQKISIVGGFSTIGKNNAGYSKELQRQLVEIFESAIQELAVPNENGTKNILVNFVSF